MQCYLLGSSYRKYRFIEFFVLSFLIFFHHFSSGELVFLLLLLMKFIFDFCQSIEDYFSVFLDRLSFLWIYFVDSIPM